MPPKKHLDSQGRRRNHCRRAVQLSEFLRGDDEPGQPPVPPTDSQGPTESSIGTIPSTDRSASCVTVTPVVTPDTTTDEPEKVSLQEETPPPPPPPPPPVNVWQLSTSEKDRPQGTFVPDDKAFPGLGKQGKKCKPLLFPEASRATRSPDLAKARRVCPVLGNFLPESLFPDKNRTVARWLSSVRSAQDTKAASGSPARVTILKRAASQQQPKKGTAASKPEISHEPASSVAVEAVSPMECNDELLTAPQKTLGSCSEKELEEQMSLGEEIKPDAEPAMEWEQSQEKEMQNEAEENRVSSMEKKPQQTPHCFSEHIVAAIQPEIAAAPNAPDPPQNENQKQRQILGENANERETAPPIRRSLLNANAQEFRPRVREPEREQEQWFPGEGGGPSGQQLYNSRLTKRKRPSQRHTRSRGQRELENQVPAQQHRAIQGQRARPAAGQHHLELSQRESHRESHRESYRESHRESYRAFPYRAPAPGAQQRQQQQQQHVQQQQYQQQQQQVQRQQYQQQLQQQRQHQQQLQQQRQQQQQHQQQMQMQQQQQQQQQYQQLQQQRQHRARAAPRTQHSLHNHNLQQNNQMYPGYVAAPTAYGHPSATPRYAATPPVYSAQPPAAASLANPEYVTGHDETLDYVGGPPAATLEYVAPNRYGGGYAPAIPESEFYPYIWEMQ